MSGTRRSLENYDPAEQETLMYVQMHRRVTHSHVRSHHVDADEYGRPIMHSEPSHPPQDIQPARDGRAVINHGDCLLYTSPSPRDKRQPRMPSSA